jgi:hypothetical protein
MPWRTVSAFGAIRPSAQASAKARNPPEAAVCKIKKYAPEGI